MKLGVRLILVGVVVPVVMWMLWGDGYSPGYGLVSCFPHMRLVFREGTPPGDPNMSRGNLTYLRGTGWQVREADVAIPFSYVAGPGLVLVALGAYFTITRTSKRTTAQRRHTEPA